MRKTVDQRAAIEIKKIIAPVLQAVQRHHPESLSDKGINIFHSPTNVEIHINSNNTTEPETEEPKNRCSLPRPEVSPQLLQFFESLTEEKEQLLFDLFKALPRPRWDTLQYCIFKACADRNMTIKETAEFMDMYKTTISQRFRRFGIDVKRDDPRTEEKEQ
jgi:hypothetical protein